MKRALSFLQMLPMGPTSSPLLGSPLHENALADLSLLLPVPILPTLQASTSHVPWEAFLDCASFGPCRDLSSVEHVGPSALPSSQLRHLTRSPWEVAVP